MISEIEFRREVSEKLEAAGAAISWLKASSGDANNQLGALLNRIALAMIGGAWTDIPRRSTRCASALNGIQIIQWQNNPAKIQPLLESAEAIAREHIGSESLRNLVFAAVEVCLRPDPSYALS